MDSVNRSSKPCTSTPASSFLALPPQDQLALLILERLGPQDKPTLRNIASTNRQIYLLVTPSMMQAYIDHAENKMQLMKTSAEKVPTFFMIKQKLAENAGKLPVKVAETLWKRLEGLILEEVNGLLALQTSQGNRRHHFFIPNKGSLYRPHHDTPNTGWPPS
jgi:hypothetical protein